MREEQKNFWYKYEKKQQEIKQEEIINKKGKLYSVLFNANEDSTGSSQSIRYIYNKLLASNNKDEDIFVLEGDGKTKNRFVNQPATLKSLDSVINNIRNKSTSDDKLLVYVTNHGFLKNGLSYVRAYDSNISEKDFQSLMEDIPNNYGVFHFTQCFSGGFAQRMGYNNNIGISNASKEQWSIGLKKHPDINTYFLYKNIFKPNISIENAFTKASKIETGFWLRGIYKLIGNSTTPQLRWQNADPSKLFLNNN